MGGRGGASHAHTPVVAANASFGQPFQNADQFLNFATQAEAEQWHLAHNFDWQKWNHVLTDAEREGVYNYTDAYFRPMNTSLRNDQPDSSVQAYIDSATSGLAAWENAANVVTYRGANYGWTANLLDGSEADLSDARFLASKIGKKVADKGFMSSGTHIDSAWTADVYYTIYVHEGISGMYVDPISAYSGEKEFLFNRDTTFIVHGIVTDDQGKIKNLVLEAVGSKHKRKK